MKFVLLFLAVAQAIKMEAPPTSSPIYPGYFDDMNAKANEQHATTMGKVATRTANQIAGVAESAADQAAYNEAHGCSGAH